MSGGALDLLDFRRRVFALYAEVRAASDPTAAHAIWTRGRDELLRTHPASPVPTDRRAAYPGADVARYDPTYRFVVPVDIDVEPLTSEHETGTDGLVRFERVGRVALGPLGTLDVWWLGSYGGGLFVPMRDTSPQTYGGGRYVLDTVKGADLGGDVGGLVVDLNFAYQPSCAYDEAWACPLAPPGNWLAAPVAVGERYRSLV